MDNQINRVHSRSDLMGFRDASNRKSVELELNKYINWDGLSGSHRVHTP